MKLWVRLIACGRLALLTALTLVATAADTPAPTRFSQSLTSADRTATGPEIHGSFTLGMGFGKGYSERFGGMTLTYEDPARNLAISFSYLESHVKGAGPFYLRDPLYDANRIPRFGIEREP